MLELHVTCDSLHAIGYSFKFFLEDSLHSRNHLNHAPERTKSQLGNGLRVQGNPFQILQ